MGCGLLTDSLGQQGFYVLRTSVPEGIFYGNMVAVAETGLDIPGGRQADPVAGAAEFPMNGADKTDTARKAVDPVIAGGAIAVGTESGITRSEP